MLALIVKKIIHRVGQLPPKLEAPLQEYKDLILRKLLCELPPLRNIQYQIDFILELDFQTYLIIE